VNIEQLDAVQLAFINLSAAGKHQLEGPPGSGKTNLLLLRAQYIAGRKGEKNVLIITYTNALADFMRTGLSRKGILSGDQVRTFHSWAVEHIGRYLGVQVVPKGENFDDDTRARVPGLLRDANKKLPSPKLYSAIYVDEAQDLTVDELDALLCLSDAVCVSGDLRQGIYQRDGLDIADRLGLQRHQLVRHYRVGQRICHVADRLIPPAAGQASLEATSNYNPKLQGESTAKMWECASRDEQFKKMCELISVQLDAFKDDMIGIICGRNSTVHELKERFAGTPFEKMMCFHGKGYNGQFGGKELIHVLTIHSAKGTEFRAVHMYGAEDLANRYLDSRQLAFTAVTRAKTALNAFRTGSTNLALENAFAEPAHIDIADLF
jgi:superfamily I DNA/RNA helicase